MANLPHANMAKKRIQPACSQPAASLQPACSQPAAAAAALPPRARARRCRLPGNILAGVAAYTNAPQRVRFISYILVRPQHHLHVTLSPPIPLDTAESSHSEVRTGTISYWEFTLEHE
jgi:hypothetical protein